MLKDFLLTATLDFSTVVRHYFCQRSQLPYQIEHGVLHNLKHRDDIIILDRSLPIFTILILDNTDATFGQRINYIFDHGWLAVDAVFESICPGALTFSVSSIFANSSSATVLLSFSVGTYLLVHSLGIFLSLTSRYTPEMLLG